MLEAVTHASWLVQAINHYVISQLLKHMVVGAMSHGMQPYNFLHQYQKYAISTSDVSLLMGQNACALLVCYLKLQKLFRSVHMQLQSLTT